MGAFSVPPPLDEDTKAIIRAVASDPAGVNRRRRRRISLSVSDCHYDVVRTSASSMGWRLSEDNEMETEDTLLQCNVYWVDCSQIAQYMRRLLPWQSVMVAED